MRILFFFLFIGILGSCQQGHKSIVLINNIRAEGNIREDSIFDGVIRFYDNKSNRLLQIATYLNGIQNGPDTVYFEDGKLSVYGTFADGKQNGYVYGYDKSGNLISKNFFYYNFRTGNNVDFLNNRANKYYFYSLDDDILFYLNYDSIKGRKLPDLQSNYFFYRKSDYELAGENEYQSKGMELFLYTPNPPRFDFRYSLVLIDSTYKVLSVLKEFDKKLPWSVFDLNKNMESANAKLAIKLRVEDSINDQKMTLWKKLR